MTVMIMSPVFCIEITVALIVFFPGDRRANKTGGYNYEPSRGSYGRNYGPAEPEWYTEGPISQSDTIELHGFDGAHSESSRTRHTSGSDASHDDNQLDGHKPKARHRNRDDRAGNSASVKNKDRSCSRSQDDIEASDSVSNTLLDGDRHQKNDHGVCLLFLIFLMYFCFNQGWWVKPLNLKPVLHSFTLGNWVKPG